MLFDDSYIPFWKKVKPLAEETIINGKVLKYLKEEYDFKASRGIPGKILYDGELLFERFYCPPYVIGTYMVVKLSYDVAHKIKFAIVDLQTLKPAEEGKPLVFAMQHVPRILYSERSSGNLWVTTEDETTLLRNFVPVVKLPAGFTIEKIKLLDGSHVSLYVSNQQNKTETVRVFTVYHWRSATQLLWQPCSYTVIGPYPDWQQLISVSPGLDLIYLTTLSTQYFWLISGKKASMLKMDYKDSLWVPPSWRLDSTFLESAHGKKTKDQIQICFRYNFIGYDRN